MKNFARLSTVIVLELLTLGIGACGLTAFGIVVLGIGLYFLSALGYHGHAYVALGIGTACLLEGLVALAAARIRRPGGSRHISVKGSHA